MLSNTMVMCVASVSVVRAMSFLFWAGLVSCLLSSSRFLSIRVSADIRAVDLRAGGVVRSCRAGNSVLRVLCSVFV
ncbi:hypothetical protein B0H13DRAFT_1988045 [Mycena leptocephala]|nr:hypothetical protein B0H13DRAFT_1987907 [Mycena leptocephala]KAJ7919811.1 hypothetical protein B0H13DRAFT_1988045 [Mycena leptocephala]